jgi:hypothetical protein
METRGDKWFDDEGRRLILRGVNLGGDCKIPAKPRGASHVREGFYEGRSVSFVGRPFPVDEAEEHLGRLRRWGMNVLRLLVTWEAVEHGGPGAYDDEYLDYIERVVAKADELGFYVFLDPHQDVWSRWTGGDGAPLWTLELAGFKPERLHASAAAFLHQEAGDPFPRMVWPAGYNRLGAATMFSLFFGGNAFAPGIEVEGRPIQDFLQDRFIEAMGRVAVRVGRFRHVIGFDSLNEPNAGFIALSDLRKLERALSKTGPMPTPWDAMQAGSGHPVEVDVWGVRGLSQGIVGRATIGREGVTAWREGAECVWKLAGVWREGSGGPELLEPAHFASVGGRRVDFSADFLLPFVRRYITAIRSAADGGARLAVFIEGVPEGGRPPWDPARDPGPAVNATHWYDGLTLFLKRWTGFLAYDSETHGVYFGPRAVRRYFRWAMARIKAHAHDAMGGIPSLLGEFGLPFDLNGGRAYRGGNPAKGDYRVAEKALSAYYDAIDAALLDSTIWNYSAGNTRERGDLWNGEDLSVYSSDEAAAGRTETGDPRDAGGRALRGLVRPYARAVAGEILEMSFDGRSGEFRLRYVPDPSARAPTEIFLPGLQYPGGFVVETEGCQAAIAQAGGAGEEGVGGREGGASFPAVEPRILDLAAEKGAAECLLVVRRR